MCTTENITIFMKYSHVQNRTKICECCFKMKRRKEKQWNQKERAKREYHYQYGFLANFLMVFVIGGFQRNTNNFQGDKLTLFMANGKWRNLVINKVK